MELELTGARAEKLQTTARFEWTPIGTANTYLADFAWWMHEAARSRHASKWLPPIAWRWLWRDDNRAVYPLLD